MAPSTPSRDLVFLYPAEMICAGGRHVANCWSGLGTRGPLVPDSPTLPILCGQPKRALPQGADHDEGAFTHGGQFILSFTRLGALEN